MIAVRHRILSPLKIFPPSTEFVKGAVFLWNGLRFSGHSFICESTCSNYGGQEPMADRSRWNLWFYGVRRLAAALLLAYRARSQSGSKLPHSKLPVIIPCIYDRKWGKSDFADLFSLPPRRRALRVTANQTEKVMRQRWVQMDWQGRRAALTPDVSGQRGVPSTKA